MIPNAFEKAINWKCGETYYIIAFSDVHFGCSQCDEKAFKQMVADHKDKENHYFICLGDLYDAIIARDPRFRRSIIHTRYASLDNVISNVIDDVVDILSPISDRLLGISTGNHEDTYLINSGFDITQETCKRLKCAHLGYTFFYHLLFKYDSGDGDYKPPTRLIKLFGHHGYGGGGRTHGYSVTKYGKITEYIDTDIILTAHDHDKWSKPVVRIGTKDIGGQVVSRRMLLCNCGTFMKTLSGDKVPSYSEKQLYPPREIGYVTISIRPTTNANFQTELHAWC